MKRFTLAVVLSFVCLIPTLAAQDVQSPEAVFGFKMGADRNLINWQQITSYFAMLDAQSDRLTLTRLGKTTMNRPMVMAIISSAETIARLDAYREIQQKLARPYQLEDAAAHKLIEAGKIVVIITMNIHSTEIAASQESVELAYELVTGNSAQVQKILEHVIILLVPSLNPDGQDMVTKWYMRDVGSKYEGSRMPMKYHHYADHDNNRDWFFFNLKESRHVAKVLYHEWYPEIVMDQHQMGSQGARFFLPPYSDPVNPNVPPALMASVNMLGKHVIWDMHDAGFTGLVTGTVFNAFFQGTMSKTPLWHNRVGILTEAASVHVASPIFFPKSSLRGMGIDLPEYSQQTNFLAPWPGGWWRLRDIIDYEKAATYAILDLAATHKTKFKQNFYRMNREAIRAGSQTAPFAYIVPLDQHDPNNAVEMLRRLRIANVDIYAAEEAFTIEQGTFPAGTFIIPLAQPTRAYIKDLMEAQRYPNLREYPGGPPRQPYDVTGWTLPLQFGVTAIPLQRPLNIKMKRTEPAFQARQAELKQGLLAVERRFSHSYKLINALQHAGVPISQVTTETSEVLKGTFLIRATGKQVELTTEKARLLGVPLTSIEDDVSLQHAPLREARIAVYQPWIPRAYDEGWLRLILDEFGFLYTIVHNEDFKKNAHLRGKFDVLIFGSQDTSWLVDGKAKNRPEPRLGQPQVREQYRGGIGKEGIRNVRQFLQNGGRVLFLGEACNFAIDKLHLPAENVLRNTRRDEYFAPGTLFRAAADRTSKLAYGLQDDLAIYKNRSLALTLRPYNREIVSTVVFGDHDLLLSGWAVGEDKLHNRVALAEIPVGDGEAILYAFRVQHRGQTYGSFKLLFNALYF